MQNILARAVLRRLQTESAAIKTTKQAATLSLPNVLAEF